MNLNPWDVQSKQIHTADGVAPTLYSGECRWGGGELYVLIIKKQDNSSNQKEDADEISRNNRRPSDT